LRRSRLFLGKCKRMQKEEAEIRRKVLT